MLELGNFITEITGISDFKTWATCLCVIANYLFNLFFLWISELIFM